MPKEVSIEPNHRAWIEDKQKFMDCRDKLSLIDLTLEDEGYKLVEKLFKQSQQAAACQGLTDFLEFKISKVTLINNPEYEDLFVKGAHALSARREGKVFEYQKDEQDEKTPLRDKVLKIFKDKTEAYSPKECYFLPVWHGTKEEVLSSILKAGFANLAKADLSYYGKGVYGSTNAEYVKRVYSGGYHKGVLLLNWVAVNSPYPVAGISDIEVLRGKGNRGNHDAHYIPVRPRNLYAHKMGKECTYFPLESVKDEPSYDEIAVFNERLVLARYIVKIERIIPKLEKTVDYLRFSQMLADDEEILLSGEKEKINKEILLNRALKISNEFEGLANIEEELPELAEINNELGALILRNLYKKMVFREELALKNAQEFFLEAIRLNNNLLIAYVNLAKTLILKKLPIIELKQTVIKGSLLYLMQQSMLIDDKLLCSCPTPTLVYDINNRLSHLIVRKGQTIEILSLEKLKQKSGFSAQEKFFDNFITSNISKGKAFVRFKDPIMNWITLKGGHTSIKTQYSIEDLLDFVIQLEELGLGRIVNPEHYILLASLKHRDLHKPLEKQEVFKLLKLALNLNRGLPETYALLGKLLYANEKIKIKTNINEEEELDAQKLFERSIWLDEGYYYGYVYLGELLLRDKKSGFKVKLEFPVDQELMARGLFEQAIEINPELPLAYARLAQCLGYKEIVNFNKPNTRKFLNKRFSYIKDLKKYYSLDAQEIGKLAFYLNETDPIHLIALASTLKKEESINLANGTTTSARMLCLEAYKIALGPQSGAWSYQSMLPEILLELSKTFGVGEKLKLQGLVNNVDVLDKVQLLKKIMELRPDYKDPMLTLSKMFVESKLKIEFVLTDEDKKFIKNGLLSLLEYHTNDAHILDQLGLWLDNDGSTVIIEGNQYNKKSLFEKAFIEDPTNKEIYGHLATLGEVSMEALINNLKGQSEREVKEDPAMVQGLELYVTVKGTEVDLSSEQNSEPKEEELFNLEEQVVSKFLNQLDKTILILQGKAGSSKSLFGRLLEKILWKNYLINNSKALIPLFISLPQIIMPEEDLVEKALKRKGFDERAINLFRNQRFVFILDGFDEIGKKISIFEKNMFNQTASGWKGKIIISSRLGYLNIGDEVCFTRTGDPREFNKILKYFIVSFSEKRISDYINNYAKSPYNEIGWNTTKYLDVLDRFKGQGLNELIKEPFLLQLMLRILPALEKEKSKENGQKLKKLTRYRVYQCFMDGWFKKEIERLTERRKLYEFDKETAMMIMSEYSCTLGFTLLLEGIQMIDLCDYDGTKSEFLNKLVNVDDEKIEYDCSLLKRGFTRFFESPNKNKRRILKIGFKGSPIKMISEGKFMFLHKSFQEYFAAQQILKEILYSSEEELINAIKNGTLSLNKKNLMEDVSILKFIVDVLIVPNEEGRDLKERLFSIIFASRKYPANLAAANAATLLNLARISFSGRNLKGVNLSGVDLSGAILDQTNLEEANLVNTKLRMAWMRGTNLKKSNMIGASFGELACLKSEKLSCDYSPNGDYFAAANDKVVNVYSINHSTFTIKLDKILSEGHTDVVTCMTFNADNQWLVSGSKDKTICFWNIKELTKSDTLKGHTSAITCIAVSMDSHWLASGSEDNKVILWNLFDLTKNNILFLHDGPMEGINFSSDSQWLLSESIENKNTLFRLWSLKEPINNKPILTIISPHGSFIFSPDSKWLAFFSPDSKWLASGNEDKKILCLYNLKEEQTIQVLSKYIGILSITFSTDSKWLAYGSEDNKVYLWNFAEPAKNQILEVHKQPVRVISFSQDNQWLASGSEDSAVYLKNLVDPVKSQVLIGHARPVRCLAFSFNDQWLASGSNDNTVRLWNLKEPTNSQVLIGHTDFVRSVIFSPDSQWLTSKSSDKTIRLWSLSDRSATFIITENESHSNSVSGVSFDPKNEWLASGSWDKTIRLWNISDPANSKTLLGHENDVNSVVFSYNNEWLASGGSDAKILIWKLTDSITDPNGCTPKVLSGHTESVRSVVFSYDNRWLASGSSDKTVLIWDLEKFTLHLSLTGHNKDVNSIAFSSNNKWLASGSRDNTVFLWYLSDLPNKIQLSGHIDSINSIAFSPDNKWLASGSWDKTVRLWNLMDLKNYSYLVLTGHSKNISSVAFSNDGHWLASGDYGGKICFWSLNELDPLSNVWKKIFEIQTNFTIYSIAYSIMSDGLFFATGGSDYSVRLWKQNQDKITLMWTTCQSVLCSDQADISNAQLSANNLELLRQHGAIGEAIICEDYFELPTTPIMKERQLFFSGAHSSSKATIKNKSRLNRLPKLTKEQQSLEIEFATKCSLTSNCDEIEHSNLLEQIKIRNLSRKLRAIKI